MKTTKSYIYLIESIIDICISLAAFIYSIISLSAKNDNLVTSIILLVASIIFAGVSTLYLINTLKKKIVSTLLTNILALSMCLITLISFILMVVNFHIIFFIIFILEFILTSIVHFFVMDNDEKIGIKYPHLKRNKRRSPTCTIQISTEYLVKDSYTPEEAEKTINQLYSLHENEGFSMKDYETIKEKIIKNIKK